MLRVKNKETLLLSTTCFLAGIVAGFLISPIKKGIYCGNNNGNHFSKKQNDNLEDKIIDEINDANIDLCSETEA